MRSVTQIRNDLRIRELKRILGGYGVKNNDGGPGSGNWGHEGRPGEIGGSAEGGGTHNRIEKKNGSYTSFSKIKKAQAKPHKFTSYEQFADIPDSSIVMMDGKRYMFNKAYGGAIDTETNEKVSFDDMMDKELRVAVPDDKNPNFSYRHPKANNDIGKPEQYTDKRHKDAKIHKTGKDADNAFRKASGELYQKLSNDEKFAFYDYTGIASEDMNAALRSMGNGKKGAFDMLDTSEKKNVARMTEVLNKSISDQDMTLRRGCGYENMGSFFGVDDSWIRTASTKDLQSLVGRTVTDHGFMSCGSSLDTGMTDDIDFQIFAPKGTRAMYVEPFSALGGGDGMNWDAYAADGKSKQASISRECETILQRGTSLKIRKISRNPKTNHIEVKADVVAQEPKKLN